MCPLHNLPFRTVIFYLPSGADVRAAGFIPYGFSKINLILEHVPDACGGPQLDAFFVVCRFVHAVFPDMLYGCRDMVLIQVAGNL